MRSSHHGGVIGMILSMMAIMAMLIAPSVSTSITAPSDRHWCDAIANNGFNIVMDGMNAPVLNDSSWLSSSCDDMNNLLSSSTTAKTKTLESSSLSLTFTTGGNSRVRNVGITRDARLIGGNQLAITQTLRYTLGSDTRVEAVVSTRIAIDTPIVSEPVWSGELRTISGTMYVYDANVCDGSEPIVLLNAQRAESFDGDLGRTFSNAADVAILGSSLTMQPSSLLSSARAFMRGSTLQVASVYRGMLASSSDSESVVLLGSTSSCNGGNCEQGLRDRLQRMGQEALSGVCDASLDVSSVSAAINAQFVFTDTTVTRQSFTATTTATVNCNNGKGSAIIALAASGPQSPAWPLDIFQNDNKAQAAMVKAAAVALTGSISGSATGDNGQLYSITSGDLWSSSLAGVAVVDKLLDTDGENRVRALFLSISSSIQSKWGSAPDTVRGRVNSRFPNDANAFNAVLAGYKSFIGGKAATMVGLLTYVCNRGQSSDSSVLLRLRDTSVPGSPDFSIGVGLRTVDASLDTNTLALIDNHALTIERYYSQQEIKPTSIYRKSYTANYVTYFQADIDVTSFSANVAVASFAATFTSNAEYQSTVWAQGFSLESSYHWTPATSAALRSASSMARITSGGALITSSETLPSAIPAAWWTNTAVTMAPLHSLTPIPVAGTVSTLPSGQPYAEVLGVLLRGCVGSLRNVLQVAAAIEKCSIDSIPSSATVFIEAIPTALSNSIAIKIRTYNMRAMGLVNTVYQQSLPMQRVSIGMLVISTLDATVMNGSPEPKLTITGSAAPRGWVLPMIYGMQAGTVMPGSSVMSISISVNNQNAGANLISASGSASVRSRVARNSDMETFSVAFSHTGIDTEDYKDTYTGPDVWNTARVSPSGVQDALLATLDIPNGVMEGPATNVPLSPLTATLASVNVYKGFMDKLTPYLQTPIDSKIALVFSQPFRLEQISGGSVTWDITWNGENMTCVLTGLDNSNIASLGATITTALANNCGLGRYVRAEAHLHPSKDGPTDVVVSFFPVIPGILWKFSVYNVDARQSPYVLGSYSSPLYPSFGTWEDLIHITSHLFDSADTNIEPSVTQMTVSRVPGLVPVEVWGVFPEQLPVITLPLNIRTIGGTTVPFNRTMVADNSTVTLQFANDTDASSYDGTYRDYYGNSRMTDDNGDYDEVAEAKRASAAAANALNMARTTVNMQFTGAVVIAMGAGTEAIAIPVTSCFNDTGVWGVDSLVPSGLGSMTINVRVEHRKDRNAPTILSLTNQVVTLSAGVTVYQAVLAAFAALPDATINSMWNITRTPPTDFIDGSVEQIDIALQRQYLGGNEWLLPLWFEITDSTLPMFARAGTPPATYRSILSKPVIGAQISAEGRMAGGSGAISIIPINIDRAMADVTVNVSLTSQLDSHLDVLHLGRASAALTLRSQMNDTRINMYVNNTMHVSGASVSEIAHDLPAFGLAVALNQAVLLDEVADVVAYQKEVPAWTASYIEAAPATIGTLKSMQNLPAGSLCGWLTPVLEMANSIALKEKKARSLLPFLNINFGDVLLRELIPRLASVTDIACNIQQYAFGTIEKFCNLLADHVGGNCIGHIKDKKVDLTVRIQYDRIFQTAMVLPLAQFFKTSKLPVGFSTKAQVDVNSHVYAEFKFIGSLTDDGSILPELHVQSANITADVQADVVGGIDLAVGSLALRLASMHAELGKPLRLQAIMTQPVLATARPAVRRLGYSGRGAMIMARRSVMPTGVAISVSGNAKLVAGVQIDNDDQCSIGITISDINNFLSDGLGFEVRDCDGVPGRLVEWMTTKLVDDLFAKFFMSNSPVSQFARAFRSMITQMYGGDTDLAHAALPLIDIALEEGIKRLLTNSFLSSKITDDMATAFKKAVHNAIATNEGFSIDPKDIHQLILRGVTEAMCKAFEDFLVECPEVPIANDAQRYEWLWKFKKLYHYPITNLGFELGNHGVASFGMKCDLNLDIDWSMNLNMTYTLSHGLQIHHDIAPHFFEANVKLATDDCGLSGHLGFVGAEMKMWGGADGHLIIPPAHDGERLKPDLIMNAGLDGHLLVGLVNLFGDKDYTLDAWPNFQMQGSIHWPTWRMSDKVHDLTPMMNFSDVKICIGHVIGDFCKKTLGQVQKYVFGPLDKVIGPGGLLNKEVATSEFLWGRRMTVAEIAQFVAKYYCSNAVFEGLMEALRIAKIYKDIREKFEHFSSMDGCFTMQQIRDFKIDLHLDDPVADYTGSLPSPQLVFDERFKEEEKAGATATWKTVVSGRSGIKWHLNENPGQKLIQAMLNQNFPIVGYELPRVEVSMQVQWGIPVWPFPIVTIEIGFRMRLTMDIGEVAFTMKGVRDAITKRNPLCLLGGLAVPTRYDNGAERWPLTGSIGVTGGVGVSIGIFSGGAYAFVDVYGKMAMMDVRGDGWATISDFLLLVKYNGGNPFAAFRWRLELHAGFGIYIKACVWKKCWTIVKKEWTLWVIPLFTYDPKLAPPVATDDGEINTDLVEAPETGGDPEQLYGHYKPSKLLAGPNDIATIVIGADYKSTIDMYPAGLPASDPPQSLDVTGAVIRARRAPQKHEYNIKILGVRRPVIIPASPFVNVFVNMTARRHAFDWTMTPVQVNPLGESGITFTQNKCKLLTYTAPAPLRIMWVQGGVPCRTVIGSEASNEFLFTGNTGQYYPEHSMTLDGPATAMNITVSGLDYTISSKFVKADGRLDIQTPNGVLYTEVVGSLEQGAVYTLLDVDEDKTTTINGGIQDDAYKVPNFHNLLGTAVINGALGLANWLEARMFAVESGHDILITSDSAHQARAGLQHALQWFNVPVRHIYVKDDVGTHTNITIVAPEYESMVHVDSLALPSSTVETRMVSCLAGSDVRVTLQGGKQHVLFGANSKMVGLTCSTRVTAPAVGTVDGQLISVTLDSGNDTLPMQYTIDRGRVIVTYANSPGQPFVLLLAGVNHININGGVGGARVHMLRGTDDMEVYIKFANQALCQGCTNEVRIESTSDAVFITGPHHKFYAGHLKSDFEDDTVDPLVNIRAPIYIAAQTVETSINIIAGRRAVKQDLSLDSMCIIKNKQATMKTPTATMCGTILGAGWKECRTQCHVGYIGEGLIRWFINTTDYRDTISVTDALAPYHIHTFNEEDRVAIKGGDSTTECSLDLGIGMDYASIELENPDLLLNMGKDTDPDAIDFFYHHTGTHPYRPSTYVVSPLSKRSTRASLLEYHDNEDLVSIKIARTLTAEEVAAQLAAAPVVELEPSVVEPKEPAPRIVNSWMPHISASDELISVTSCGGVNGAWEQRFGASRDRNTTLVIANLGVITSFGCSIHFTGFPGDNHTNTIVLLAGEEQGSLMAVDIPGTLKIWQKDAPEHFVMIYHSGVNRFIAQLPNSIDLELRSSTRPTERVMVFPTVGDRAQRHVRIWGSRFGMIINGTFQAAYFGAEHLNQTIVSPLSTVKGTVAIVTHEPTPVFVIADRECDPHHILIDDAGLWDRNVIEINAPSDWLCQEMLNLGVRHCSNASIAYGGRGIQFVMNLTNGIDNVVALNPQAGLVLHTFDDDDTLIMTGSEYISHPFWLDVGDGQDKVTIVTPLSNATLELGDDDDWDIVDIYYPAGGAIPTPRAGDIFKPVSGHKPNALAVQHWLYGDLVSVKRLPGRVTDITEVISRPKLDDDAFVVIAAEHAMMMAMNEAKLHPVVRANDECIINVVGPHVFPFDIDTSSNCQVTACDEGCRIMATAVPSQVSSSDWTFRIDAPPLSQGIIEVVASMPTNGQVYLNIPAATDNAHVGSWQVEVTREQQPTSYSYVRVSSGLVIQLRNVDATIINSASPVDYTVKNFGPGVLKISGPKGSTADVQDHGNMVIMGNLISTLNPNLARAPKYPLVMWGRDAIWNMALPFLQNASYWYGCLQLPSRVLSTDAAGRRLLTELAIPLLADSCPVMTNGTAVMNITGLGNLKIKGMHVISTAMHVRTDSNTTIDNDRSRAFVHIDGRTMNVDNEFGVTVDGAWAHVVGQSLFMDGHDTLLRLASPLDSNNITWNLNVHVNETFGTNYTGGTWKPVVPKYPVPKSTQLRWNTTSSVGSAFALGGGLPAVVEIIGELQAPMYLNVTFNRVIGGNNKRDIQLGPRYVEARGDGVPTFTAIASARATVEWAMVLADAANEITIVNMTTRSPVIAAPFHVYLQDHATVTQHMSNDSSMQWHASQVLLASDGNQFQVSPTNVDSNREYCLEPRRTCTPDAWRDTDVFPVLASSSCQLPEPRDRCRTNAAIVWHLSNQTMRCLVPRGAMTSSIEFSNVNSLRAPTATSTWITPTMVWYHLVLAVVVIGHSLGSFRMTTIGWPHAIISAALPTSTLDLNSWSWDARGPLLAMQRAVNHWNVPFACSDEPLSERTLLVSGVFICVALFLTLMLSLMKWSQKLRENPVIMPLLLLFISLATFGSLPHFLGCMIGKPMSIVAIVISIVFVLILVGASTYYGYKLWPRWNVATISGLNTLGVLTTSIIVLVVARYNGFTGAGPMVALLMVWLFSCVDTVLAVAVFNRRVKARRLGMVPWGFIAFLAVIIVFEGLSGLILFAFQLPGGNHERPDPVPPYITWMLWALWFPLLRAIVIAVSWKWPRSPTAYIPGPPEDGGNTYDGDGAKHYDAPVTDYDAPGIDIIDEAPEIPAARHSLNGGDDVKRGSISARRAPPPVVSSRAGGHYTALPASSGSPPAKTTATTGRGSGPAPWPAHPATASMHPSSTPVLPPSRTAFASPSPPSSAPAPLSPSPSIGYIPPAHIPAPLPAAASPRGSSMAYGGRGMAASISAPPPSSMAASIGAALGEAPSSVMLEPSASFVRSATRGGFEAPEVPF